MRKKLQGWSVTGICISKVSCDMFYRWWNRYLSDGKGGLKEKVRGRPKGSDVEDSLKNKVIKLRERYGWGPKKIVGRLKLRGYEIDSNQLGIEHMTASVRRSTICGKIEAFYKAYELESYLFKMHWSLIRYYNYTRSHGGINYLTPAEIYLKEEVQPIF